MGILASPVSLQTLITRVLQRSNLEGSIDYTNAGNKFCTVAELTDLLNSSYANEVWDLLREFVGDNYCRSVPPFTLTTNANQTLYQCPADLLAIISVDVYINGAFAWSARRYYEFERNLLKAVPFGWNTGYPVRYQLQGMGTAQSINFLSIPESSYRVDLNYIKNAPVLVNLTDTLDDVNGWSEIAVLDAASKLLIKDGQLDVAQYLDARKNALVAKVRAMGPQRHAGEPEVVNQLQQNGLWGNGGWLE